MFFSFLFYFFFFVFLFIIPSIRREVKKKTAVSKKTQAIHKKQERLEKTKISKNPPVSYERKQTLFSEIGVEKDLPRVSNEQAPITRNENSSLKGISLRQAILCHEIFSLPKAMRRENNR